MTADQPTHPMSLITGHIVRELAHSLNQTPESINPDLPFVDMGADSLILAEALQDINRRYKVTLPIGEIYENVNTIVKVARFIFENGNWQSVFLATTPVNRIADVAERESAEPPVPEPAPLLSEDYASGADGQSIESIVRQQLELMERQLQLLGRGKAYGGRAAPAAPRQSAAASVSEVDRRPAQTRITPPEPVAGDRFSAFSIKLDADTRKDDTEKVHHIGELTRRFNARTPRSRDLAQAYRRVLSDNRVSAGFRPLLKELVYPILAEKAEGAYLTDIDGNAYVDFTMGFGVHLFGHSPEFVANAIREQLGRGMPIGPQSPMAGRVAELVCELTGHERAVFCNSGTEATMTALRLARAKTGREKVVIFKNSYHGTFDGFLARTAPGGTGARPASLGTPASAVQDTVVLDYCSEEALRYVAEHHTEIAAVVVEPVQSRAPSLRPGPFLKQLREITRENGVALIFDEIIAGFRCAPGGAQEYFGVQADISTYGKIIGGGMPIGMVAGSATYMDGIDGGWWQYGDSSYPMAPTIFFAGTFSKHPLTMAASIAVLEHIKSVGRPLYDALNDNTRQLVERLNKVFEEERVDILAECFSSLFRFSSMGNIDLFFYHLMDEGIYIWEGRNCFVSTAHTSQDLNRLVAAVRKICRELVPLGLLPLREATVAETAVTAARQLSDAQQRFLRLERSGPEGSVACNVCFGFRFDGPVDLERLRRAVSVACGRQDALWFRIDAVAGTQRPAPPPAEPVDLVRLDEDATSERIEALLAGEQRARLDLASGQNLRLRIHAFADGAALLSVTAHHLVCDGWALNVLLQRMAELYADEAAVTTDLPYGDWLAQEVEYRTGERLAADRAFWQGRLEAMARHRRDVDGEPTTLGGRPGGRATLVLDEELTARILAKARADGTTPFIWLLGAFQVFLNRVWQGRPPVIGLPFANRTSKLKQVVGNCVNLLPFLPLQGAGAAFAPTLAYTKQAMNELFAHSRFPYHEMCDIYRELDGDGSETPVGLTFNVEPITAMPRFGEVEPRLIAPVNSRIEFDLMFNLFLLQKELRIELDYNTDRHAEDAVYGWLYLFSKILENSSAGAVAAPADLVA